MATVTIVIPPIMARRTPRMKRLLPSNLSLSVGLACCSLCCGDREVDESSVVVGIRTMALGMLNGGTAAQHSAKSISVGACSSSFCPSNMITSSSMPACSGVGNISSP